MSGAKCSGTLNMDSLEVGSSLVMRDGAEFTDVVSSQRQGRRFDMSGAKCSGALNMDSLKVVGHLLMRGEAQFGKTISHLV